METQAMEVVTNEGAEVCSVVSKACLAKGFIVCTVGVVMGVSMILFTQKLIQKAKIKKMTKRPEPLKTTEE